ncbi:MULTISPECIES: carbohydrate ABC transporter permease [Rhizobium]|uniref:carbohydrate ABC transporter permease n=1 Tax=Rhizobium TaxID=379 RepID=UPI0014418054|nr:MULTISPECIES: carbohydrate ABC transporter permease [Rhizobium]MBX4870271.1 carbohydrate ABC transporter permease [Rhizobium bangladeshense]MBX5213740.1 carbohydrate ABC transporter permease [Rhizobium sp. NLR9a]MBX5219109.1 carbohydrate ABC transporter permease [Rhizobium sp. NLR8a]MBX5232957.1 carbohydrate ABC transporter permease [Rhizobium sp. NLR4a]MBX5246096.1 carbohydrate ABC transporter permease [Rhizobium sp. NLR3b]
MSTPNTDVSLQKTRVPSALLVGAAKHGLLLLFAAVILLPFVWMLLAAVKDPADIFSEPFSLDPAKLHATENFGKALTAAPMGLFMFNSLVVVVGVLSVQLVTSIGAAYALAQMKFRGRGLLFGLVLFALCVPVHVPALPLYIALAKLGLLNSYFALMFPWFFSAFAIFLFRQHFLTFPQEIINAARVDGFTEIEIVLRLVVPSALPAIAAFSVFSVTAHWNDLYWPLIVINVTDKMTAPLGLLNFQSAEGASYGPLMAAATIITLPLIGLFLLARRYFVEGVTMTGVK